MCRNRRAEAKECLNGMRFFSERPTREIDEFRVNIFSRAVVRQSSSTPRAWRVSAFRERALKMHAHGRMSPHRGANIYTVFKRCHQQCRSPSFFFLGNTSKKAKTNKEGIGRMSLSKQLSCTKNITKLLLEVCEQEK